MPTQERRIETALSESRILVLGIQMIISFEFNSVMQSGFARYPAILQYFELASLSLLLVAFGFLAAPAPFHHVAFKGQNPPEFERYVFGMIAIALAPFAAALGIGVFLAVDRAAGLRIGAGVGGAVLIASILSWYGLEALEARRDGKPVFAFQREESSQMPGEKSKRVSVDAKVEQVLTETRVVLPGAQALLGFQFVGVLTPGFQKLPISSKYMHGASILMVALSTILLMAPAAYHRLVDKGDASERFVNRASAAVLLSLIPLSLGMCGDLYIVARIISKSLPIAAAIALALALFLHALWFGYSFHQRRQAVVEEES